MRHFTNHSTGPGCHFRNILMAPWMNEARNAITQPQHTQRRKDQGNSQNAKSRKILIVLSAMRLELSLPTNLTQFMP